MDLEFNAPEEAFPPGLLKALRDVGYKPGFSLFLHRDSSHELHYNIYVVPQMAVVGVVSGQALKLGGYPVYVDADGTLRDLLGRIFKSLESLEVHECAEQFTYRGHRVCDPHLRSHEQEVLWDEALGLNVPAEIRKAREGVEIKEAR